MEEYNTIPGHKTVTFGSLATEALISKNTDDLFTKYRNLFVEVCARWISSGSQSEAKIAAFGRILPLSPHLVEHATRFLTSNSQSSILRSQSEVAGQKDQPGLPESDLREVLLGTFRLLSYDCVNFSKHVRPLELESLFHHPSRHVRYLAVRTLCLYVHAADHATHEMIKRYVGENEVLGEWEGKTIDYRFLSLWEEKRWSTLQARLRDVKQGQIEIRSQKLLEHPSPFSVNINGILLPRLNGAPSREQPSELIPTPTTDSNLRNIASGLLGPSPLLLTGLAGSGKTLLTRHFAWQLNKLDSMVTLHLNEQSDAKLLVGMYATGAKPGTFSWRPGVLTRAVKEGRWIFIEDLDRAPNEVISTLLPLIERGELLIPSRGEIIRAARGFRVIATMRTTLNSKGQEIIPRQNIIGNRFWNGITVHMPDLAEFQEIISAKYRPLQGHVVAIIRVYSRLLDLFSEPRFSSENGASLRALTPRDLLKWCDRIAILIGQSASFNATQMDDIFMEALDCFAGSLRSEQARSRVMSCVAEELHIDPQRKDHLLFSREVQLDVPSKGAASRTIRIGRVKLEIHRSSKRLVSGRPFSTNDYTLRLLEKVAVAVDRQEPLLLVGETGTGKTTAIQYLAEQLGRKLVAFNLYQQSESGDLLGGYKPVNMRSLVIPLKDEFDDLFDTTFSRKKNQRFLEMMGKRVAKGEWKRVCVLWREALKMVDAARKSHESRTSSPDPEGGQPKKKRKVDSLPPNFPRARWEKFAADLNDLEAQLSNGSEAFAFSFLEGNIVKAVRNGDWVLLDEINLASSDTLEALVDLLGGGPDGTPSILLTETGNVERVVAHPNFRVFAAMNPATDVGKKDLPPGIRSRFTELYVESPDSDVRSLRSIVEKYLGGDASDPGVVKVALDVTNLYLEIQRLAKSNILVDGADQKAHFSLRTLTRTLSYAREMAALTTLRRALYEGFHMSFLTFLGKTSEDIVAPLIKKHLFGQKSNKISELSQPLKQPRDGRSYVSVGQYWLRQGSHAVEDQPHYIITPFVQRNMDKLIRAASTRRYPVLIQGPTSSGKTSMIEYLAKRSGNKFVRINNHEHTDLQEYLGSYISGADGKLQFQEGILVRALREGHWIVLDELNLAPTDVLEALNRLLDDNRELLIPETQEVVRPHEDFMLFATQNPAGLYGGRKVLSRAFRNRFLELHFDDIPVEELTEILHQRTMIPESWCKRIVKVYEELSTLRQENRLFEQKSFATLRDLFRWAQRKAESVQDLANNGYMLLAERVRKEEERQAVKRIIEMVMSKSGPRVYVDEERLYSEEFSLEIKLCKEKAGADGNVVWTQAMRRLFVLVAHAIRNNEPVLLVGETGCGKTTACQMLADAFGRELHIVNAHQNTETGDLIGAQRPIRNRANVEDLLRRQLISVLEAIQPNSELFDLDLAKLLDTYDRLDQPVRDTIPVDHRQEIQLNRIKAAALFEWADGSLVQAMKMGQFFLLDEISLADDSVLERLNSVLESSRTLLLAEKGPMDSLVTAAEGFQFLATMNPGGDYGKRELSPALRNRFTEIWVPSLSNVDDILQIVRSKLMPAVSQYAGSIVSFAQWFNEKYNTSAASSISIRDTLAWVTFINNSRNSDPIFGIVHGAAMVFIDTLGANPAGLLAISPACIDEERNACLHRLSKLFGTDVSPFYFSAIDVTASSGILKLGPFSIPKFSQSAEDPGFSLEAPTTRSNAMRVVRALQLPKPILLEGNPGVGKTTLVTAIAGTVGKPLTRLNLSEQTDLMDLFGSDVPVEDGQAGTFAWRDAPFLRAMRNGDWVLLDEMNLAPQSVLEGLNAVLDHRGEVYISELDQTFQKHPDFRVFAAQNPHHQGGGRKGLPASFVNRFTVVYADVFRPDDLSLICTKFFPGVANADIKKFIDFVAELDEQVVNRCAFGVLGSPWEFNLRDTLRWLQLITCTDTPGTARDFLDTIFMNRFRSEEDRNRLLRLFNEIYGTHEPRKTLYHNIGSRKVQVGLGLLSRDVTITRPEPISPLRIAQLAPMESFMISVQQNWPVILVGAPGSGKTSLIRHLASLTGAGLATFSMNPDVDATDLVGGYEQVDPSREVHHVIAQVDEFVRRRITGTKAPLSKYLKLLELLNSRPNNTIAEVCLLLGLLSKEEQDPSDAVALLHDLRRVSKVRLEIEGARFQWVDGVLIQALEHGKWLVLDNANLCSSSVLDRLNSLLEPNGYLSINEHPTADGEARIVRPHPNFRIFLTMDPRYGELSRAMRNRAVEICLLSRNDETRPGKTKPNLPSYPLDSFMYRFRHFDLEDNNSSELTGIQFDHLSLIDRSLLQNFEAEASKGLVRTQFIDSSNRTPPTPEMAVTSNTIVPTPHIRPRFSRFLGFILSIWEAKSERLQAKLSASSAFEANSDVQPYHPLNNELFLHQPFSSKTLSLWYASVYEILLDLYDMQHAVQSLPSMKFERRIEKQKLPVFLHAYWHILMTWGDSTWQVDTFIPAENVTLKFLRVLFWAFFELASTSGFDRATFQTYVEMANDALLLLSDKTCQSTSDLRTSLSKELAVFGSDIRLKTGLSMERIWRHFKSHTPNSAEGLSSILSLERLADRLDAAMWKSNLKIEEMVQIQERFADALAFVKSQKVDAADLISTLESAVQELEDTITEEAISVALFFEDEFEGLCQYLDILEVNTNSPDVIRILRSKSTLLARRPTRRITAGGGHAPSQFFSQLYRFVGLDKNPERVIALEGRLHIAILNKMNLADEVQLAQLERYEAELQILSQHLSLGADHLTQGQHDALPSFFRGLVNELVASHSDLISFGGPTRLSLNSETRISQDHRDFLEKAFVCCMNHQTAPHGDPSASSQAWFDLALAGISLYIPNYPVDPALKPMIERKFFNEERLALAKKLDTLRQFQLKFTGQDTSFRIRQVEQEIEAMGSEPPVPAVIRPAVSELDALQGEFTNLLSILNPLLDGAITVQEASRDSTLRQNILHIIRRLADGYRSYDDITGPAVGFLVCLSIGLTLGAQVCYEESDIRRSLLYITRHTPFFGLSTWYSQATAKILIQECKQELSNGRHAIDLRWHALQTLAIITKIEDNQIKDAKARALIQNIFASLYRQWKEKLIQDQEKEAKNSSLYTYRGDQDQNAEEEDPELFPDYDKESDPVFSPVVSSTSREHAIRLADLHGEIFLGSTPADESVKRLIGWCVTEMANGSESKGHGTLYETALPAIFLALERRSDALTSSAIGRSYNFYFDANIPEAKRLIGLVHMIQSRYRQIRRIWPEHATLTDVLRTCEEVLAFRHADPVAKFITKAEKLHGYMHEWQRVASREFSAANLYDNLTKLLVSWRQLELTAWAQLFNIEMEKCRDDAKSWFFVAYETTIAAPESIEDEKAMKLHAKELLRTLEGFFSSTTLGQFHQRITLLQQFRQNVALRLEDDETFKPIHLALGNFIAYFSRLENPVQEALRRGRQTLEEEVNNVIKLASWKDTNIEALKQSAKTSHRKLSKLVRKFRALLNQSISGIYKSGFPDEQVLIKDVRMEMVSTSVDEHVLETCNAHVPDWAARPTRFKNLAATVSIMRSKSSPNVESINGAVYIDSFITDLETSMTQLHKATPSTLTEENKETVQHLKTRKRKLFADTLKELRQMGFKSNHSSNVLAKQDELATVLANLPNITERYQDNTRGSEYFLHKTLSIMPQVREISKEHSGDLTSSDVARSIGYLESLLHATIRQRAMLSRATEQIQTLQLHTSQLINLSALSKDIVNKPRDEQFSDPSNLRSSISWLATILKVGADIVDAQAKLGKTNDFSSVTSGLQEWSTRFQNLVNDILALPVLPPNMASARQVDLIREVKDKVSEFQVILNDWIKHQPVPRGVLQQIVPWVTLPPDLSLDQSTESVHISVDAQNREIFEALDLMLGSMQDVGSALDSVPGSMEDASWLIKEEQAISTAITALHGHQIAKAFSNILTKLQYLQDQLEQNSGVRMVASLFASVLPIVQQYLASYTFILARYTALHTSITKLLYRLSKTFLEVGTQGFCTPPEKPADQRAGKDEKLESGTGLGEGEGAEDISKDIQDDEDLEDLAQEKGGERERSIEEEEDAVDMGEQEMEGEMGDVAEKEDQDGEEGEDEDEDVESQVGSVDDLGPSAVDDKMWDEGGKEDDAKDKEGNQDVGTENKEEQVAASEKERKGDDGGREDGQQQDDEDVEMEGDDQEENVGVGEVEKMDPLAKEEETLDLPDKLNMDGKEDKSDNEDLGDMDMDDEDGEEMDSGAGAEPDTVESEVGPEDNTEEQKDTTGHVQDEGINEEQEGEEPVDDDIVPLPDEQPPADELRSADDKDRVDANTEAGTGIDANEDAHQNEEASTSAANHEEGSKGGNSEQNKETSTEEETLGQTSQPDVAGRSGDAEESPEVQPFKKIGDAIERWYNQQRQIRDARKKDESQVQQIDKEVDMADAEFEHLPDDETHADTQALGTASEEQAKSLGQDLAMAVNEEEEKIPAVPEDNDEVAETDNQDIDMEDAEQPQEPQQAQGDGRPRVFIGEQKPFQHQDQDMEDAISAQEDLSETSSIHSIETQLELTHLNANTSLPTPETARALWLHHESTTHTLSQQLTEHLRLILAPTLATKLRGDFRTGKRLNLRRIIPYIASGYKRDKIWLRRSQPSKRNYQIMIALDDSISMAESGASNLALKTLALITRSLSMLEVGEVSVVGFGDSVMVAHEFGKPFTSESGVKVFSEFGFRANKTNVKGLIEKSLELFRDARQRGPSGAGEDLWQLMLIVSDGICDSHAEIQRLVRQAKEERVMLVFIIVDATAGVASDHPEGGKAKEIEKEKTSILDLQSVEISPEGKVVRWKYMDRFPFGYYLVVRDVRELPGVLSGALRQWFAEVVESSA
ncbi:midasin [Zopfia rhizophila CBS 207.26]|uniref:Midasin n=1 Tax=Zopfia rhizophila CBS 207.26 TaxID=1314779 RepID=A0A6A6E818_9PEZI|nr:midasin [Zopfia rhizophila CBS 207.26]